MDFSNLNTGQTIVISLSIFLVFWYVIVGYLNRQRGIRIYRWLRDGLETCGQISDIRWIGSAGSGAQISITNAGEPFSSIEATVLLESRELLPLWIFNLLRNKKDELILKASLRKPPRQVVEITRKNDRDFERILSLEPKLPYSKITSPSGFQIAFRGQKKLLGKQYIFDFLERSQSEIVRVSLGPKAPHLLLRCGLSQIMEDSAEDLFSSLQDWLNSM